MRYIGLVLFSHNQCFTIACFGFCFCFCLKPESPLLFPYYPRKSLHFVKRRMENIIDQCLQKPAVSLKEMHVSMWSEQSCSVWPACVNDHDIELLFIVRLGSFLWSILLTPYMNFKIGLVKMLTSLGICSQKVVQYFFFKFQFQSLHILFPLPSGGS